jgi:hypothetical protein
MRSTRARGVLFVFGILMALPATPGRAIAQGPNPLSAVGFGEAKIGKDVTDTSVEIKLKIRNAARQPVTITRVEALLASQGGWSDPLGETIATEGRFFGGPPTLDAGGDYEYGLGYGEDSGICYYLLALQYHLPNGPSQDHWLQVPLPRRGFRNPPPLRLKDPVFIGLQEPMEALELNTGEVWLPVAAQVLNVSGKPLTLKRWKVQLRDDKGKLLVDEDLTSEFKVARSNETRNETYHGFALPKGFRLGKLRLEADLDLGGRVGPLVQEVGVARAVPAEVAAPVRGAWLWGNGPGAAFFAPHFHTPFQRYAYDMVVRKDLGGGRRDQVSGDTEKNESFFCWDQPIYAVKDGKVIIAVDDVPDNFGRKGNPANSPLRNGVIYLEHPGPQYSAYYHIRRGGARVKVGQLVKAGQEIGRAGNAGSSSEPHLHFAYLVYDHHTGRLKHVPVRIKGLSTLDGRPTLDAIPKGDGTEFVSKPGN